MEVMACSGSGGGRGCLCEMDMEDVKIGKSCCCCASSNTSCFIASDRGASSWKSAASSLGRNLPSNVAADVSNNVL